MKCERDRIMAVICIELWDLGVRNEKIAQSGA